ncbi:hypothetical protein CEXT_519221 [Caerostris extrusa]|uniref:Uncharacterized protein n=1 Tax=Caerostris extrusa TaxID=172846 RepID=A0AAV4RGG1_CAEEX|nr:hypothetical protein CEXT_519221 [Caerostris extrusa]
MQISKTKAKWRRGPEKPWGAAVEPPDNKFGGRITLSLPSGDIRAPERERGMLLQLTLGGEIFSALHFGHTLGDEVRDNNNSKKEEKNHPLSLCSAKYERKE